MCVIYFSSFASLRVLKQSSLNLFRKKYMNKASLPLTAFVSQPDKLHSYIGETFRIFLFAHAWRNLSSAQLIYEHSLWALSL